MSKRMENLIRISQLEELARRDNWLNNIHSLIKLIITIVYIFLISSIGKYELTKVLLFMVYPVFILTAADIPIKTFVGKMIIPICLGASLGMLNPFLDKTSVNLFGLTIISAGWLSFVVLWLKSTVCIAAAFILVSTSPIEQIVGALESLKFPKFMSIQILLMFRYITILISEFERALTAYSLRTQGRKALEWHVWGSFMGQIFIRTAEKSVRLYESMKLRGFNLQTAFTQKQKVKSIDVLYMFIWVGIFTGIHIWI